MIAKANRFMLKEKIVQYLIVIVSIKVFLIRKIKLKIKSTVVVLSRLILSGI